MEAVAAAGELIKDLVIQKIDFELEKDQDDLLKEKNLVLGVVL